MDKQITVSASVLDFFTGIHTKGDASKRSNSLFSCAFNNAYRDMSSHTIAYKEGEYKILFRGDNDEQKKNKEKLKKSILCYMREQFGMKEDGDTWNAEEFVESLGSSQDDFNKWHKSVCKNLTSFNEENCPIMIKVGIDNLEVPLRDIICHVDKKIELVFTCGQAQKLVNMMLKYLYIYDQCEGRDSFKNVVKFFHVPLDSFVLKEMYDICPDELKSYKIDFKAKKYKNDPWSKIEKYEKYMECQKYIKDIIGNENPFMWELENWPFEKDTQMEGAREVKN